jgi:hypothetical protein
MPLNEHPSEHGSIDLSEERARAVDEAGRRAGAALRRPAPAHGAAAIRHRAHRRRVVRAGAATAGVGVLVVVGVLALTTGDGPSELQPGDTLTTTNTAAPDPTTPHPTTPDSTASPSTVEATSTNPPVATQSLDLVEAGTLFGHPWPRYSADSSLLAIESTVGNVLIHDSATLTQLRELPCPTSLEPLPDSAGTAPSPDSVWDVAAAARWDADALTVLTSVSRPQMCGVTLSADGTRAVTDADVQGNVPRDAHSLLWDTSDGSLVAVIPGLLSGFSADGSRVVISNGPSFSIVESSTGAVLSTITDDADGTVSSPDGSRLLRWGTHTHADGTPVDATIYDMRTLTPIATLSAGSRDDVVGIEDPVFDDTNGRVAALDASGLAIWDASTGAELQHVAIELVGGRSVAFFPGGAMIAVRNGSHITIIDSSSGVQLTDLDVGADRVEEVVFSADGVSLAAGVAAGARIWFYDAVG